MRKFILLLILLIIASTQCYAQGVSHTNIALYNAAGFAKPVPSAVITVCTANDTAVPCINIVSLFTNFALTTVLSNPFNADANGNYSFFVAPGNYTVTVTGVGITGFSYQVSLGTGTPSSLIGPGVISGTFSGNHTTTGNNIHSGTEALTGGGQLVGIFTGPSTFSGTKVLNGIRFADQFVNINAAVTDAGSTGAVLIPPTYSGTDSAFAANAPIIDFRQNTQGGIGYWHGVRSMFPVGNAPSNNFPGGNDFPIYTFGPADIHLQNNQVDCTSTTSVAPGTTTITVGTCSAANGGPSGTTAILSPATGVVIVLEPGTANEEVIQAANWSILSGTTLSVTTGLSHTQPYTVRQQGQLFADGRIFLYNAPSGTLFYGFGTAVGNQPVFNLPVNTGATWPFAGISVVAPLTGGNSASKNLLFRSYSTSSIFRWASFANTTLLQLTDAGALTLTGTENITGSLGVGKATAPNFQLDVQAAAIGASFVGMNIGDNSSDRVHIGYSSTPLTGTKLVPAQIQFGAVAVTGDLEIGPRGTVADNVVIYTSPDAGTTGLVEAARFTPAGNLAMSSTHFIQQGTTTVGALPAAAGGNKGWMLSVSDSTAVAAEGQTCVGGSTNTALAFSNGVVWKCF